MKRNVFVRREDAAKLDAIARQKRNVLDVSFELADDRVVFDACRARDEARHVRSALHADDAVFVVFHDALAFIERVREHAGPRHDHLRRIFRCVNRHGIGQRCARFTANHRDGVKLRSVRAACFARARHLRHFDRTGTRKHERRKHDRIFHASSR